jgi:magnesium-transporting ATPase (P-type)
MKMKYIQSCIFLILLILTIISQYNAGFPVVPGWHTVIYPPKYIIEMSIIILSLILAISGYTFLSFKKQPLNSRIFVLHFLLTIPIIIALLYPFKSVDMTSLSKDEMEKIFSRQELMEYVLISVFIVGQLIFLTYFTKHVRLKPSKQ